MVNPPRILAVIPARGGSKGIPRKNIKDFAGYPLIAWSIAAALKSRMVTRTIVSTDDEEIAAVSRQWGAETPFLRPTEYAQDNTTDLPVFQHALGWLAEKENYQPDVVVQLRPTSPIRPLNCVDDALAILLNNPEADSVRGVVPAGQNPHKMWRIEADSGKMKNLLEVEGVSEPFNAPRQILPLVFWQTGHIDAIRPRAILNDHSMSGKTIFPLLIDSRYTVDIDTPFDWMRYEWLVQNGGLEIVTPGQPRRSLPKNVHLVALDFDGVLTDNRVWVNQEGKEMVAANRSDSMGINFLRERGIAVIVISSETNPVVEARCKKLNLPVVQGVKDKVAILSPYMQNNDIDPANVIFLGNDSNDVPCFRIAGCGVAVADAQTEALQAADIVLSRPGGRGAVRELCDMILRIQHK